ncbi:acetyltransferase [Actinoplanes ianthinogenes]|uniref:Acetyltransferase n=1 Tax=Actinoplanes ianthinogenes TaxID=122358 RepID=A0ABM7M718_9ACTN|nr:GNAT family N-acetyltransferase [Actinoplanes ianthinogenes]BCJ47378.1 acetyltransferase [Actinoplanes ianthinogenes]GGR01408.1 acetyltransferase [Actinoplanes ianthinogenes]
MIKLSTALSPADLEAIAELERRVVAADGGRLKLEWDALRGRSGPDVEDVLWWEGERLLGFLGIYSHGAPSLELAGMVDPEARRRGIGTALLDAALRVCQAREHSEVLLVVPRSSAGGPVLAQRRGGKLDHSEHALRMVGEPTAVPADPRVTVRAATPDDQETVRDILRSAFGWAPPTAGADPNTLLIERDGHPIGTVRLSLEPDGAGIYGFAVHPDQQGRGVGRDVLHRLCRQAGTDVHLEVATDNDRALHLYTSLGFQPVITEDYYALPY